MSANGIEFIGNNGQQLLPKTRTELVYHGNERLSDIVTGLSSLPNAISRLSESINSLQRWVDSPKADNAEVGTLSVIEDINYKGYLFSDCMTNGVWNEASKVSHSISINGKSFNGQSAVDVGTIGVGYGGTGLTSLTANRIIYASSSSALSFSNHYVSADKMSIGLTTAPADGVSLLTKNSITSGGNVMAYGGVAALGIADADGSTTGLALNSLVDVNAPSPTSGQVLTFGNGSWVNADLPSSLGIYTRSFGNNEITADADFTLTHNLGNANPMVMVYETNTTATGDVSYKPMVYGSGGSTFYIKFTSANSITFNMGATHTQHKVKIIIIG